MADKPNARSLHSVPVSRSGGVAIITAILTAASVWWYSADIPDLVIITLFCTLPLSVISFIDDKKGVAIIYRLLLHLLIATVISLAGLSIGGIRLPAIEIGLVPSVSFIFSVLFVIWSVSLFNFMDGIDGLAGGMAVIGFSVLAIFGLLKSDEVYMTFNAIIAAASAGFLMRNFSPAKIFMGDCGSSILGFFMAVSCLWGDTNDILPLWVSLLIFSPFIVDSSLTLIRRIIEKENIWQAHKSHFYQLLVRAGWSHKQTVLYEYVLMLSCGASSFLILTDINIALWALIISWFLIYLIIIFCIFLKFNGKLNKQKKP